jgi:dolichol-phosphate mannosyltransferase
MEKNKLISIITPVFNEEHSLDFYYKEVSQKLFSLSDYDFEVIFIDDGSGDKSWQKILNICNIDPRFNAIRLSRNFGAHLAVSAGIDRARGDAVVILACDMQDPVETVIEFLNKWREGYQIVWGERISRADSRWRIAASVFFNYLLRKWAMPEGSRFTTGSFLLMDRRVADCFRLYEDNSRLTFAMVAWTGFDQEVVPYHRKARIAGKSGWSFSKMVAAFYNAVLAYSTVPLKIITVLSLISILACVPIAIYLVYLYVVGRSGNIGWISTILTVIGFSGIILLQLSLTGEYLVRVYKDASRRPLYFVADDTLSERYFCSRPGRRKTDWEHERLH